MLRKEVIGALAPADEFSFPSMVDGRLVRCSAWTGSVGAVAVTFLEVSKTDTLLGRRVVLFFLSKKKVKKEKQTVDCEYVYLDTIYVCVEHQNYNEVHVYF